MSTTYVWLVLLGLLALTAGIDVYLGLDGTKGNTFSANLRRLGRVWPPARLIICTGIGVILGHLWWAWLFLLPVL